jgi:hypothetical protein
MSPTIWKSSRRPHWSINRFSGFKSRCMMLFLFKTLKP